MTNTVTLAWGQGQGNVCFCKAHHVHCSTEGNSNVTETEQVFPGFKLLVISKIPFGLLGIVGNGFRSY